ncbi:MAG: choice-of-anchor Q domain-containing protein [Rudaea sp.]|uniref:choice-of-anchor Q domain-containing protein n=1 Tax=Rudaea sp. TaxID=2136325 RepID=UPI0039E6B364
MAAIPASERQALIDLYTSTSGAGWSDSTHWNGAAGTECTWYGVVCDAGNGHVTEINLQNNQLTGSLPDLSALSAVQILALYANDLHGPIPALGALAALQEFYFDENELTGSIPALDGLASLQRFSVYHNHLTGSLPPMGGLTSLLTFDVGDNALSGSMSAATFPPNLVSVYLDGNAFGGPAPTAPTSLAAHGSRLCPNRFTPAGSSESANDEAWDVATHGSAGDLWSAGCPTVETAVANIALTPAAPVAGSPVTVSFDVPGPAFPLVSGTVSVHDDADPATFCPTATLATYAGSCELTFATPGPHSITVVFQPDSTSYGVIAPSSASISLFVDAHAAGSRCYVKADATGARDGSSWANAYTDLQWALQDSGCAEIWVAKGVYKPTSTSDPTIYFDIHPGVAVYGGFAGNETTRDARDAKQNPTVLSGDIDGNDAHAGGDQIDLAYTDIAGHNSWHVVVMFATTALGAIGPDTVLDGFTITGGGVTSEDGGGFICAGGQDAVTCNPTLANLVFSGNLGDTGGAMLLIRASSPTVSNTTFRGNHAGWGGAIFLQPGNSDETAEPAFVDVTFSGNSADYYGGVIYNSAYSGGIASVYFANATFNGNSAAVGGGVVFNTNDSNVDIHFVDTILWGDTAPTGAEIERGPSSKAHFSYSIVQGSGGSASWDASFGTDDGDNLDADPKLGPLQDNGGWTPTMLPLAGSAAIDSGGDICTSADQRGVATPQGAHCDIGAVEVKQVKLSVVVGEHGRVDENVPPAVLSGGIANCTFEDIGGCPAVYSSEPDAPIVDLVLTPDSGYAIASVTTTGCDGGLSGNVYTTAALAADCEVDVSFAQAAPPVAIPQNLTVVAGSVTPIALAGSDPNAGGPWTFAYAIATPPAHGSVVLSGNLATYTAPASYTGDDSFTFTVSDANGTSVPAFVTITVTNAATPVDGVCGSDDGKTLASTPTNLCSAGTPSVVAGDGPWTWTCSGSNGGATASCSAAATRLQSATSLVANPNPATVGQNVTVQVLVNGLSTHAPSATALLAGAAPQATPIPTGTATVSEGANVCTATISNGSGSCALSFATAGTHVLTAVYSGDANYVGSSGTAQLVVAAGATPAAVAAPSLSCWALVLLGSLILLVAFRCGARRIARR